MVRPSPTILVCLACFTFLIETSSMEYTTSIAVMTKLLSMEKDLIDNLSDYANLMQEKLDTLNLALRTLRLVHNNQSKDPEEFLSNPLNSFALMRRMHLDWPKYYEHMKEPIGQEKIAFFERVEDKLPTAEDFKEAQNGILRLQEIYEINETDMARGFLQGTQYNVKLSVLECFAMGKFLKEKKGYEKALKWFKMALQFYEASYAKLYALLGVTLADIWHMIADQLTDMNENIEGLDAINNALALRPNDSKLKVFQSDLKNFLGHERLCAEVKPPTGKHLHCRYNATHPYFVLGPLKMEELSIDPYIPIYYNVMQENEMRELKNTALPLLQRSRTGIGEISSERVANQFPFFNNKSDTVNRVSQRLDFISGLVTENEPIVILNYGIGGHHYCHTDHYKNYETIDPLTGNRKFIVLGFLQDVVDGGALVFPRLNFSIPSQKGAALIFPTLDNAGNPEERTLHASCPVVFGSKWSLLKVFFTNPQMFRLPCYA